MRLPIRYPKTEFFIAPFPAGNDSTGNGSFANPWATPNKARDYIIQNKINLVQFDDIHVKLLEGTYYDSAMSLVTQNSGRGGNKVIYESADGLGAARMVGGVPVTGWVLHSGSVYKANIGAGLGFNTLYENGHRARKARYPKFVANPTFPGASDDYLISTGNSNSHTVLKYGVGELSPAGWNLTDAEVFIWSGGGVIASSIPINWFTDTVPIASVDTVAREITLTQDTRYPIFAGITGSRYCVQGVLQFLTEPGEYHYDSTSGFLYYWPVDGAIDEQEIIRPTTTSVFSCVGSSEAAPVLDVSFDGFEIACTDWTDWYRFAWVNDGDGGACGSFPQYDRIIEMTQHRKGGVLLQNAERMSITNCHFKGTGYSSIFNLFYNKSHTFRNLWLEHAGHSGLYFEGRCPGSGDVNRDHTIQNVKINDYGQLEGGGTGMYIKQSGHSTFTNMDISRGPRCAFFVGSYPGIAPANLYGYGSVFSYIKMDTIVTDSGDVGALSTSGLSDLGATPYLFNTFDQMTINKVAASPSMLDAIPNAVFPDNWSAGQVFSNIRVTNSPGFDGKQIRFASDNTSGDATITNCSFLADGTADPSFNPALLAAPVGSAPGTIGTDGSFPW